MLSDQTRLKVLKISLGIISAMAQVSPCMQEIIQSNSWQSFPSEHIDCIVKNPVAAEGLAGLCNRNQSGLTQKFAVFRRFQNQYNEARARLFNAKNPLERAELQAIMQDTEIEWIISGFRAEMTDLLNLMWRAENTCRSSRR